MRRSIQKKIGAGIAIIILVMTNLGVLFTYTYAFTNQYRQQKELDETALGQYVNEFQTVVQDVLKLSRNIAASKVIQEFLSQEDHSYFQVTDAVQEIKNITDLRVYINNAVIIQGDNVYWTYSPFEDYFKDRLTEDWYTEIKDSNEVFSRPHSYGYARDNRFITYILQIPDPKNPDRELGQLLLNINVQYFKDILERVTNENGEYYFVDTRSGQIILQRGDGEAGRSMVEDMSTRKEEGKGNRAAFHTYNNGYFVWRAPAGTPFAAGIYTSRQELNEFAKPLRHFYIAYTIATVISVILLTYMLLRQFLKPVSQISSAMLLFAEGRKTRLDVNTGDEFQVLGTQFNSMADSIESSITRRIHDEKVNKKLKFDMLMSKIHPHFLYNTLNSVIYLARREGNGDIEKMVQSLILILQDGMAAYSGRIDDPLEVELEMVSAYCVIQSYRYKDKFQLICKAPDCLKKAYIPKNILQPLVENAIYHGIAPMDEPGTVEILVERELDNLRICVADSGIGMDEKTLDAAKQSMGDTKGGVHSIGMKSIWERLEYLYQDQYVFELYSERGKGTTVLICIPYMEQPVQMPAENADLYEGGA